MPYTLNLYSAVCQLYLNKAGKKKENPLHLIFHMPFCQLITLISIDISTFSYHWHSFQPSAAELNLSKLIMCYEGHNYRAATIWRTNYKWNLAGCCGPLPGTKAPPCPLSPVCRKAVDSQASPESQKSSGLQNSNAMCWVRESAWNQNS